MLRRLAALLCGCVAAAAALGIMLSDAIETGVWTINQFAMIGIAVVVVFAGVKTEAAVLNRQWFSGLVHLALLAFGLLVSVWFSVARQGETTAANRAQIQIQTRTRDGLEEQLRSSRVLLYQVQSRLGTCSPQVACERIKEAVLVHEAHIRRTERQIAELPKPRVIDGDTAQVVEVLGLVGLRITQKTAEALKQVSLSLLFELAAVLAFSDAFRIRTNVPQEAPEPPKPKPKNPRIGGAPIGSAPLVHGTNVVPLRNQTMDLLIGLAVNGSVDLPQRQLMVHLGFSNRTKLRQWLNQQSDLGLIQVETTKKSTTIRLTGINKNNCA